MTLVFVEELRQSAKQLSTLTRIEYRTVREVTLRGVWNFGSRDLDLTP